MSSAHDPGAHVMHMISGVPESNREVRAGADVIVAQAAEGGGHLGFMGAMTLGSQASGPWRRLPVLPAGEMADGAGLAASLVQIC